MEYISGNITLQMIFSLFWLAYISWHKGQIRETVIDNVNKILKCRTPKLGFHAYKCPCCNEIKLIPHSCKSRFCSSCGKIATDKWTEEKLSDILPVGFHHLIFTLPWQLRTICLENRKIMLNLLFKAVRDSIISWTKEYGKYIPGIYIVLHTFGSDLKFNPHFHVLITAGGASLDYKRWIFAPKNFLMPEKGLKKRWKFNVTKSLINANNKNELIMPFLPKKKEYINLKGVISVISKLCWYIFIGTKLNEAGVAVKYIGRYTKRPVISETRLLKVSERWITFRYKDYADGSKIISKTMGTFTFITYLTQHIPDKHFRVVRGYGIFSNRIRKKVIPKLLKYLKKKNRIKKYYETYRDRIFKLTNKDPLYCNKCNVEMELFYFCYD